MQAAEAVVRSALVAPVVRQAVAEQNSKAPLAGPASGELCMGWATGSDRLSCCRQNEPRQAGSVVACRDQRLAGCTNLPEARCSPNRELPTAAQQPTPSSLNPDMLTPRTTEQAHSWGRCLPR